MNKLKIEYKKVVELIPYVNNPRNNDRAVDKVAASIKEFGFKNPIIIDNKNVIVAGHTRLLASEKLGITEVPTIKADDLTDAQIKAFRIADNKTCEFAEWDDEMLSIELEELKELDFNLDETGFNTDEVEDLLKSNEVVEDDFEVELPEEPYSKKGDIWLLGDNKILCGDSTKAEDVSKLMDGKLADMFISDPPYNVDYVGKTKDNLKIKNDKMENDKFREFLVDSFSTANANLKEGGVFYIWHSDSEGYNFRGACNDVGWQVRECLIWNKSSMVMGRQDYQWKHEPCLYGWKEGAGHLWAADRKQTTVLNFEKPSSSKLHPTMKPIKLFDYLIQNNTKGKDIVLDSFVGSGTTIMACEQNGRIGYGLELDGKYVDVIVSRYNEYITESGIKKEIKLIRDGETIEYRNTGIYKESEEL